MRLRAEQIAALRKDRFAAGLQARLKAEGKVTTYDPPRSVVHATDKAGRTHSYRLGDDGFIDAVRTPAGRVSYLRSDSTGNLLQFIEPSGRSTEFTYDSNEAPKTFGRNGQILCEFRVDRDHGRNEVRFADSSHASAIFDARGNPLSFTNRLGASERFRYDGRARLQAFVNGRGEATVVSYDESNQLVRTRHPDGHTESIDYEAGGRLSGLRLNGELLLGVVSDANRRPIELKYPDGTSRRFRYDERGRLVAGESPDSSSNFSYSEDGNLAQEESNGEAFKFSYDPTGLLTAIEYPGGDRVAFEYDLDKRLARVTDWSGAVTSFERDLQDSTLSTRWPNGLETTSTLAPDGAPLRATTRSARTGATVHEAASAFDAAGRLVSDADSEFGKRDYSYDAESQLVAVRGGGGALIEWRAYDEAGNCTNINGHALQVGSGNRLVSYAALRCNYDAHGNLIEAEQAGTTWRYRYDVRHQLVEADGPSGKILFGYDAFGRRVFKQTDHTKIEYLWCGEQLAREIVSTDTSRQVREYLYLPGTYTPLALRVDGAVYYFHCDHLGTPRRITDSNGRVAWAAQYDSFGNATVHLAEVRNSLRFPGQHFDAETGLSYNRFRYYSPILGRYITPDPIGLLGGSNLYRYVGNDPLNKTDPLGLWWKAAAAVLVGGLAAAAVVITAPVSVPVIAIVAGAAFIGISVGVGVDKALNIDSFCIPCMASAFLGGVASALKGTLEVLGAMALAPVLAGPILIGGAALGCYSVLAEHLGWPMPTGDALHPSTWHLKSGPSFDELSEEDKNKSLGNLVGQTMGAEAAGEGLGAFGEGLGEGLGGDEAPPIGDDPPAGDDEDQEGDEDENDDDDNDDRPSEGPPPIESGLGPGVDDLVNRSPTLRSDMADLTDDDWEIARGEPGQGSYCDRDADPPQIVLDPTLADDPQAGAATLAHEIGHAKNPVDPPEDPTGNPSRDAYVNNEVDKGLEDEGHATLKNAQARQEILNNGGDDISYPGNPNNAAAYDQISQDVQNGTKTPQQGAKEIGEVYRNNESTSTNGQTYGDYYRRDAEQRYDGSNEPSDP